MKTNLAKLIEKAVDECVAYGEGLARDISNPASLVSIFAEWAENEEDIEITVLENNIVRFTYTEKGVF